ncbi:TIGR03986 family CRISPR-associated RAMP protein [Crossiella sp. SN42]|uniref:TIGR03986 family type III CRISPR-associated RAMP protein n=1 Tax=Crossiella sp. SN42 TaxID=2944808 RepID=UPI00207CA51E|nr:TIGR03986 family CRISPR-associated RAMP protein [Crossiella sp. SN42]MCO1575115.1 TIGR03986 family CRISPR-associated RAMP protein [Crossiella sp. SN42]
MNGFHNPYNFIPAADRDAKDQHLGDRAPAGHHRLHEKLWTGTIKVNLTTVTPMLIPDKGAKDDATGHHTFGTRIVNGRVDLPASTVKGVLRSAYEALTNSRMGVFSHRTRLGYRPPANSGLQLRPVLITLDGQGEPSKARSCAHLYPKGHPQVLPCVALPAYLPGTKTPLTFADDTPPQHGQQVSVWAELVKRPKTAKQREYLYWRAAQAWLHSDNDPPRPDNLGVPAKPAERHQVLGPYALIQGIVHRTNHNIHRKHDERLFPTEIDPKNTADFDNGPLKINLGKSLELEDDAWSTYQELLADYRAQHTTAKRDGIWDRPQGLKPWETLLKKDKKDKEDEVYAWSRHLYDNPDNGQGPDALQPNMEITCYAELNGNRIVALYPVLISRRFYEIRPGALLPATVAPAKALENLSPADRVFGWVRNSRSEEESKEVAEDDREAAVAAALRVGPVTGPTKEDAAKPFPGGGIPLDILASPKPSQGRFYVGKNTNDLPAPLEPGTRKDKFFTEDNLLRGRKVYPHQEKTPDYWNPDDKGQEFRRPKNKPDSQNRTITSWVKRGVTFECTLHVRNLTDVELGALLLLLTPEQYGKDGKDGLHRMGGGKPLGFGSVKLTVHDTDLRRGTDWRKDFTTLGEATPAQPNLDEVIGTFLTALNNTPHGPRILRDIRTAAVGFAKTDQVHYPRMLGDKDPDGKNYEWFIHNERQKGGAASLPAVGEALPYYKREQKPKKGNGKQHNKSEYKGKGHSER